MWPGWDKNLSKEMKTNYKVSDISEFDEQFNMMLYTGETEAVHNPYSDCVMGSVLHCICYPFSLCYMALTSSVHL